MPEKIRMSPLAKTWIFDLDGTIVKHNGYKDEGHDTLLPGVKEFMDSIGEKDMVIFVTSRSPELSGRTEEFLRKNGIRYDAVIYGAPYGERILINDKKPSGLPTAIAVNSERDRFMETRFTVDESL